MEGPVWRTRCSWFHLFLLSHLLVGVHGGRVFLVAVGSYPQEQLRSSVRVDFVSVAGRFAPTVLLLLLLWIELHG